MMLTE